MKNTEKKYVEKEKNLSKWKLIWKSEIKKSCEKNQDNFHDKKKKGKMTRNRWIVRMNCLECRVDLQWIFECVKNQSDEN